MRAPTPELINFLNNAYDVPVELKAALVDIADLAKRMLANFNVLLGYYLHTYEKIPLDVVGAFITGGEDDGSIKIDEVMHKFMSCAVFLTFFPEGME